MGTSNLVVLLYPILISYLSLTTAQQCPSPGNFTTNSTYGINRNQILSSLASNVTAHGGFYTTTLTLDSDIIYALALCRADLTNQSCFDCVNSASQAIIKNCPDKKEATDFGATSHCIVRCSDKLFFGGMDTRPALFVWLQSNITENIDEFDQALDDLVDGLITRAAKGSSSLKLATGEKNYTKYDNNVYGLMQCVPGLSSVDCSNCLWGAMDDYRDCCLRKRWVNIMRASCIFQYDLSPLLESIVGAAPPPPPPPPPPVTIAPPPQPPANTSGKEDDKSSTIQTTIIIVVPTTVLLVLVSLACAFFQLRKREDHIPETLKSRRLYDSTWVRAAAKLFRVSRQRGMHHAVEDESQCQSTDSLKYEYATIRAATNDFSNANELGRGGFGSVYKGKLANGQEIAVKRLAGRSDQGEVEFKNEIVLMARLQHKYLVRLLGFCLEGKERLLIYEFVPNASLDKFIFDPVKKMLLNWETRYKIIIGIAHGLLYLHQDSQLRILHHDLKAGNILLDGEMHPKIADFGTARLFVVDQSKGIASRIVGTFGYMPPEYTMYRQFSMKTDVFSFGVLILEIVCGKKNSHYDSPEHAEHLISYAWKKWKQGKASRLIDQTLVGGSESEKMRCIHIGLLCVQQNVAKRPTMASVVLMFNSFSMSLSLPSKPAFLVELK